MRSKDDIEDIIVCAEMPIITLLCFYAWGPISNLIAGVIFIILLGVILFLHVKVRHLEERLNPNKRFGITLNNGAKNYTR